MRGLVPWALGALATGCIGCSLIIDSSAFVRPSCSWHVYDPTGTGLDATGTCDQFLCRPAGYEEWEMNDLDGSVEDAGADFVRVTGTVQSIPPAFFMPGNYNFDLVQAGTFEVWAMGRRWVARKTGDAAAEQMGLTIEEIIPGRDVCSGAFRGRVTVSLIEILGDGTPGTSALSLQIELGH